MTSSTKKTEPNRPKLEGNYWDDFVAVLDLDFTSEFADWLEQDLIDLEAKLDRFSSKAAVKKSLRRK